MIAWIIVFVYFVLFPLWFRDGYYQIADVKYMFFLRTALGFLAIGFAMFTASFFIAAKPRRFETTDRKTGMFIDCSVLLWAVSSLISYFFSGYKNPVCAEETLFAEGAFFGASGWNMGLVTIILLTSLYFVFSQYVNRKANYDLLMIPVSIIVSIWAVLNRYGIYPVDMKIVSPTMVASFGNINWMTGYLIIVSALVWGGLLASRGRRKYLYLPAVSILTFATVVNGSDSVVVALIVVVLTALAFSFDDIDNFANGQKGLVFFGIGLLAVEICDTVTSGGRNYKGILSEYLIGFCVPTVCIFTGCMSDLVLKRKRNQNAGFSFARFQIPKYFAFFVGFASLFMILLVIVNTKTGGRLIGGTVFFFDGNWASRRGATWTIGVELWRQQDWPHRIFGVGNDCMCHALSDSKQLADMSYEYFGHARLTNAHNEFITILVNNGLFGLVCYIGIFVSAVKSFWAQRCNNSKLYAVLPAVLGYLVNAIFGFMQIEGVTFLFLILAWGRGILYDGRKISRKCREADT